jgi:glycosyltransferase involved in cell wall biosynthesis
MISVLVCTYKRAGSLRDLLESLRTQTLIPDEVLIIDGSPDDETRQMLDASNFALPIQYFSVPPEDRGLTRQRNYGIKRIAQHADVVVFFDDDVVLRPNYIELLAATYKAHPDAVAVGGISTNERRWDKYDASKHRGDWWFILDGYAIKLGDRNFVRRKLGLFTNVPPFCVPTFGHGYDILPPSGITYKAEHLIGCNMSFKRSVFNHISFSHYFEGYGLYEDFDFSYRALRFGNVYVNTAMQLEHHHHPAGRPNTYKYGKMVTRNGWYVWRLKDRNPKMADRLKWGCISMLLTFMLLRSAHKGTARMEFLGRLAGMAGLIFNAPKVEY